ncbi:unnamed protein product [Peronospora belbahrii]|uniref:USP domain-containing protein n=1 Tax=Peronospora belbahrii TaxID=622444 RepID=A0ABN8D6K9_9STRA|nr:unnamed protein product [Peronospora belbahrii]
MRLGIGFQDDVDSIKNEAMDDSTSSSHTSILQCLGTIPGFLDSVDRGLRMRRQLDMVQLLENNDQAQKILVAESLVSLLKGITRDKTLDLELEDQAKQDRQRHIRDDTYQKMRNFRAVVSRCTDLVSSAASRQEQQDAEEFLLFLLELLHDLLRMPAEPERQEEERQYFLQSENWFLKKLKRYNPNDPRSYYHAVASLGELRWNHFLQQNASVITDIFSGQTVRGSQCCSCANLTCLHEEQRIISLTISSEKGGQKLAKCLEHYSHPEQLTGDNRVYCEGYCRTKTARITQILLQRVPRVLVIQLQRFKHASFGGQTEKVNTPVSFPCGRDDLLDITMNAFFRDEEKRVTFELTAVCAHLGSSIDSGHLHAH